MKGLLNLQSPVNLDCIPSQLQDTSSDQSLSGTARIVRADPGTENVKVEVLR